jgi:hypothetical protein
MTTRRNAVKFFAGAAAGTVFTPAPWKLIRDSALWSENWPGIPRPATGEITFKQTHCNLCPAGCAVRARSVGGQPVSLAGVEGGLCPLGVTGHHLPYHPSRLRSGPAGEARARVEEVMARGARPAVLDLRPGRAASELYRNFAAERRGFYLAPPRPPAAVNLAAAKVVISLGAPLLEGWLAPARVFALRDRFRLVQIEPMLSRTAALADEWLPGETDVRALAAKLKPDGQVLVIDPEMSPETVALTRELGGWGKTLIPLPDEPAGQIATVPDGAIGVLFIDESGPGAYVPWPEITPKLAPDAVVVALAWWREGYARHTHLALGTPVYPEATDDVPYTHEPVMPLVKAPDGVVDAVEFITGKKLAGDTGERAGHARPLQGGVPAGAQACCTPLFSKLYRESNLLLAPGQAALHPSSGFQAGERAFLAGAFGKAAVEVVLDAGLAPGKVHFVPTPAILDICGSREPQVVRA